MANRNQDDWGDDYRRWQGVREWEEGRRGRGECRAGRGGGDEGRGFEGRGDEGRGDEGRWDEERDFGRYGREDFGRGGFEGREGWRGGSQVRRGEGRYEDRWGGGRMGEDFGRGGPEVRRGMGRDEDFGQRYGEQRQGHPRGSGGLSYTGEDFSRGVGRYEGGGPGGLEPGLRRYIGGGWAGLDPERGRDSRAEDYGRGGGLRGTGYGMARMDVGEQRMGRGPRSYTRSDDRIREDICERLMRGWMNAENVDVRVSAGEVTLIGNVDSRDEKRAIEDLAEEVLGVKEVHNQLRVSRTGVGLQDTQAAPGTGAAAQGLGTHGTGSTQGRTDTQRQDTGRTQGPSPTLHHS